MNGSINYYFKFFIHFFFKFKKLGVRFSYLILVGLRRKKGKRRDERSEGERVLFNNSGDVEGIRRQRVTFETKNINI